MDEVQAKPQAQLVISLMPDGRVNVTGPIQNKLLCYGMIECARDALKDFSAQQQEITPARMIFPREFNGTIDR